MESKICSKKDCPFEGKLQPIENFSIDNSRKDGRKNWCVVCCRKSVKKWCDNNKDHRKKYADEYTKKNKEVLNFNSLNYYHENKEECRKKSLNYYYEHKEEKAEYQRERFKDPEKRKMRHASESKRQKILWKTSIEHRIKSSMHVNIHRSLRSATEKKNGRNWEKLVGFTTEELKNHLKNLFTEGMTWELFLEGKIHIDHIKPISSFKITSFDSDEFRECWSLKNLQPLWAKDNLKKWAHISEEWNNV